MSRLTIDIDLRAFRELGRLDHPVQTRLLKYLHERLTSADDPRRLGKALTGDLAGLWRYRVGDYRLICSIEHRRLIVLVLKIGHQREVYD